MKNPFFLPDPGRPIVPTLAAAESSVMDSLQADVNARAASNLTAFGLQASW